MDFDQVLNGIFEPGTEEYETIVDTYDLITRNVPSIASDAKTQMILLDNTKIKLSTLYFMLCRNISQLKDAVQQTVDSQYTRLVKLGRPSNAAIEAEIRATNPEYAGISRKIGDYENVKDLISSYIKCVDSRKTTALEVLRDSRRID